ncbi:MAG: metallophosphoesterase family protein [Rubripirellula sp.]
MRRFAIGDIHGCSKALRTVLDAIDPQPDDELIFMGDYIDRGPDTRDVVDQIIQLQYRTQVVALRGNHELMLLGVALGGLDDAVWLENGGVATVASYGGCLTKIPADHLEFYQSLIPYHETNDALFVHACYDPALAMHEQKDVTTYWTHLASPLPDPHCSGKRVIVGHTPQPSGDVLDAGHVVCIDTYCFGGGFLTAFQIGGDQILQANRHGHLRRSPVRAFANGLGRVGRGLLKLVQSSATDKSSDPGSGQCHQEMKSVERD